MPACVQTLRKADRVVAMDAESDADCVGHAASPSLGLVALMCNSDQGLSRRKGWSLLIGVCRYQPCQGPEADSHRLTLSIAAWDVLGWLARWSVSFARGLLPRARRGAICGSRRSQDASKDSYDQRLESRADASMATARAVHRRLRAPACVFARRRRDGLAR